MHVLHVTSELHPFSKTGGLADMVGALGKALAATAATPQWLRAASYGATGLVFGTAVSGALVAGRDAGLIYGHTLVIPRRHIGSFFETTAAERASLLQLIDQAKAIIDAGFHPDAVNIGINDGRAAGQTVPHLHIHLIPRYAGDSPDPRGGVRWVLPGKAKYWA